MCGVPSTPLTRALHGPDRMAPLHRALTWSGVLRSGYLLPLRPRFCLVLSRIILLYPFPGLFPISRGPGLWKLNCSVLDDPDYADLISSFRSSWQLRRHFFSSPLLWWDRGKSRIKELTINFCKKRSQTK